MKTDSSSEPIIAKASELAMGATVLARAGDRIYGERDGQLFEPCLEILLVRNTHVIAREAGKKDAKKLELPLAWGKDGHMNLEIAPYPLHLYSAVGKVPQLAAAVGAKKAGPKRKEGPTKMDKCRELFAANPTLDKAAMVKLFIDEAECTPAGAVTYWSTINKHPKAA